MSNHPTRAEIYLVNGEFYADDPHRHFTWMRQQAPLYWDERSQIWGVALYEDVMRFSRDAESFCNRFSSRPDSPPVPSMINLDDPEHKRRRNLVNKGFS